MGYRMIIAEDEELERTALRLIVRTRLPQYELVAQAATGIELLEMCHKHKPDVILMDISMPGINGLEAMKQLLVTFTDLEFIVLSAHADFEYAQMALQLGAFDYLTKPIKSEVLISALSKLAEKRMNDSCENCHDGHLSEQIRLALPQLDKNIFQSIIMDSVTDLDINCLQARFRTGKSYILCAAAAPLQVQQPGYFHEDTLLADVLQQLKLCTSDSIAQDVGMFHIFLLAINIDTLPVNMYQFINELRCLLSAVYQKHKLEDVCIYISPTVGSLPQLAEEFKKLNRKILNGHQQLVQSASPSASIGSAKIYALETELSQAISKGNIAPSLSLADSLYQALLEQSNQTPTLLCENLRDSLSAVKRQLNTLSCNSQLIAELCTDLLISISTISDTERMKIVFLNFVRSCCECCEGYAAGKCEDIDIMKIITFIDGNYTHDFSLDQIASRHRVSPSYLSKALKQQLGMNYIDYITGLRIDAAMDLLKHSNKTIKEITFAVGYNSQTYFCKVFKKIVGISASEYKVSIKDP